MKNLKLSSSNNKLDALELFSHNTSDFFFLFKISMYKSIKIVLYVRAAIDPHIYKNYAIFFTFRQTSLTPFLLKIRKCSYICYNITDICNSITVFWYCIRSYYNRLKIIRPKFQKAELFNWPKNSLGRKMSAGGLIFWSYFPIYIIIRREK